MTNYTATVYSRPGCQKCRITTRKLTTMGVPVTIEQIDDHPDKQDLMAQEGWSALPLVEVTTPEGDICRWADMSVEDLNTLDYLLKADA